MKRKDIIIAVAVLLLFLLPSIAKAQEVDHPNYMKALGLKGNVKDIGVFTDDDAVDMYNYCTYEFDNSGRLISYSEAERIESAYSWTAFFDIDGLPTRIETVFIDYWSEPDADGNPPVTTTRNNIRKEQNGSIVKLFIEDGDGGEKQVNVTRDDKGRIIEVDNLSLGEAHRYRYLDATTNVPCYYNGSLAFPQVDMVGGHRIGFPSQQNIPENPSIFQYGLWQFEVHY
jgi:hypothetical protein